MTNDAYSRIIGRRIERPRYVSVQNMNPEALRILAGKVTPADFDELLALRKAGKSPSQLFLRVPELAFEAYAEMTRRNAAVLSAVFPQKSEPAPKPTPPTAKKAKLLPRKLHGNSRFLDGGVAELEEKLQKPARKPRRLRGIDALIHALRTRGLDIGESGKLFELR